VLTNGDGRFEHLQTDLAPLADGLEVDSPVHQCLCQVASARAEGVGADGDRSGRLVGLKEGEGLIDQL
jgi:hypothetical protein